MTLAAVYPGTFDPVTKGHLDLIERGSALFDKLIVAVGINSSKKPMFTFTERVEMIRDLTKDNPKVEVASFSSLVVDFARQVGAGVILRGTRSFSDFEYEFQMALTNRTIAPDIETVFVMPSHKYSYVASRFIKEIFTMGGDITPFVTESVIEAMKGKITPKGEETPSKS